MISCENLVKIYKTIDTEVLALQGLDLEVADGELIAVIGNSGSGKSTLLNILGGLDTPSAGRVEVAGTDILRLDAKGLVSYRRNTIGFVWQNTARNLVPYLTALENVELPMQIARHRARDWAKELLEMVGLSHRERSRLDQLSGGEQQRVGIAIALANRPPVLLADEPTGSVDTHASHAIMSVFRRFSRELGTTVVIVTHDRQLARDVDRVVAIRDGKTSSEFVLKESYRAALAAEESSLGAGTAVARAGPGTEETHEEFILLDRVGRLQLRREDMELLGIKANSRLRVTVEDGRIVIRPADDPAP